MKRLYCLIMMVLSVSLHAGVHADSLLDRQELIIEEIIAQVSADSMLNQVRILSGEKPALINGAMMTISSRHRLQPGNALAAVYLGQELKRHGLEPFVQRFNTQGENVLAWQTGTLYPEKQFIICAHYDCQPAGNLAYGADDNASGTAAVLEAARLLGRRQMPFTVVYALWDEEEAGLLGSRAYAELASAQGHQILGVINMDMIAYDGNGDSIVTLHVRPVAESLDLAQRLVEINENYHIGLSLWPVDPGTTASDHASFWTFNYSALLIIEDYHRGAAVADFNPFYHTTNDRIEVAGQTIFNIPYFLHCAQMSIAGLSSYAFDVAPGAPLLLTDAPLLPVRTQLRWSPSPKTRDYIVDVSRDRSFTAIEQTLQGVSDSFCVPGRLPYQQHFYWRVRSRNRGGSGKWSLPGEFNTSGRLRQSLALKPGWNLVSGGVAPDDSSLSSLFGATTLILRDGAGRRYSPALGWLERQTWSSTEGYWIHAADSTGLLLNGWEINTAPAPLALAAGWQILPYWRNAPMPADSIRALLHGRAGMIKDAGGHVYWPEEGIDQISALAPGQAYQIFLNNPDTLILPLNESAEQKAVADVFQDDHALTHYAPISETGITAHLLLDASGLQEGDDVGVWAAGHLLAGAGRVHQGKALITIWGDDIASAGTVDGARAGDALNLTVWTETFGVERAVMLGSAEEALRGHPLSLPLVFAADEVWRGRVGEVEEIPAAFALYQNYPNPFNNSTLLRYVLQRESQVTLRVVNLQGQEVARLVDGQQRPGIYVTSFRAHELASGLYYAELQSDAQIVRIKMMMVR